MVTFSAITRDDLPKTRTREGKVSTKLFKEFVESGIELAQIELDPEGKSMASVRSTLSNFAKRHVLPVRVFTRGNGLYLERITAEEAQRIYVEDGEADSDESE